MKNLNDKKKQIIIDRQNLAYRKKVKKINKSIIKSLNKEIKTFSKKIYWKSFFYISYLYKTVFFQISKKNVIENKISILIPSRSRYKKMERFLDSLKLKTKKIHRIELLLLLDNDEPELRGYLDVLDKFKEQLNIKIFTNDLNTHAKRNNFLASHSTGDIIFPANDDMVIESYNWDIEIDNQTKKFNKNSPFCIWPDSGNKYPFLHCHFPIINRIWYEKLSYVASELFNFWYLDTWICDLAKRSNKFIYVKNIKIKEFNAQANIDEFDETYLKNIADNKMEKDIDIWNNSKKIRIEDAKKLLI